MNAAGPNGQGHRLAGRPALATAALFAAGIAFYPTLPDWPWVWLSLAAAFVVAAALARRAALSSLAIIAALLLAGVSCAQIDAFHFSRSHIGLFTTPDAKLAEIELEITGLPRATPAQGGHRSARQVARAQVVRLKTWTGWQHADGEVMLSYLQASPALEAGQRVTVTGMLERPAPPDNPGEFDWQRYYRRQRVLAEVRVTRASDLQIVDHRSASLVARARERARTWIGKGFLPRWEVDRELLVALLVGDRGPAMQGVEDDCNATGASHLLASSGLRVGILAACIYLICQLIRLRPRLTLSMVTSFVILLGFVMNPTSQALRPIIACAALGAGLYMRRSVDSIHFLGIAALLLLIMQPMELYSPGFQLTFVVVLGLLVLARPAFNAIDQRLRNPDLDVLQQFGRLTRSQSIMRWIKRRILELAVAGAVAWVVSLPLICYHFEQINPWAVPIDLILLPVTIVALACGFLKLILTAIIPGAAPLWAAMAEPPLWILRHGVSLATKLPGADIPMAPPPIWWIALFYLLLIALCIVWLMPHRPARRAFRLSFGGAWAMSLALPALVGFSSSRPASGQLKITVLAVGAGQCIAVEPPDGKIIFFDAGSNSLSDPLRSCIGPFLRNEGRGNSDDLFISHGDYDHIDAAEGLLNRYGLHDVYASPFLQRHSAESKTCEHLLASLGRTHHLPHLLKAGDRMELDGLSIQVLWPPADCAMNSNNSGVVLRLTFAGRSVLLPADIQAPPEAALIEHPELLHSDILIAPHHGSSESTTTAFVAAVDPKLIVSSDDRRLTNKQRTFETMIDHKKLLRTGAEGAVTLQIDRNGMISVRPFHSGEKVLVK
ncbi:MAG TPA: ComEC/Rec2 family competence protein [Tepidisphaeraceae bacterium]|nr:ComEC/Rec2 family competence protein [Tepidisphaeraceae bacterium]